MCLVSCLGSFDCCDYSIDVIQSYFESFKDMCSSLGYTKFISCPACNNFFPVLYEFFKHFKQIEKLRLHSSVVKRNHVESKACLKRSKLIKLVKYLFRESIFLEFNHYSYRFFVGFVTYIAYSHYYLIPYEISDLYDEIRFVELIRNL